MHKVNTRREFEVQLISYLCSDGQGGIQLDQIWLCVSSASLTVEPCPQDWLLRQSVTCDGNVRLRTLGRAAQ